MEINSELLSAIQRNLKWIEKKCSISERNIAKSQELRNDVLLNLYSSSKNFSNKESINSDAWVKRITTNVTASYIQKEIAENQLFDKNMQNTEYSIDEQTSTNHDLQVIFEYINTKLNAKDRQIMTLYLMQESQTTISEIIGLEVTTITNRISLLKKEINDYINKEKV